jgi:hypothetical protein
MIHMTDDSYTEREGSIYVAALPDQSGVSFIVPINDPTADFPFEEIGFDLPWADIDKMIMNLLLMRPTPKNTNGRQA